MYIKRSIEGRLLKLLGYFPAVAVLGPRQAGKTTLVKEIRKQLTRESIYLDLENPADIGALTHPSEFLNSNVLLPLMQNLLLNQIAQDQWL